MIDQLAKKVDALGTLLAGCFADFDGIAQRRRCPVLGHSGAEPIVKVAEVGHTVIAPNVEAAELPLRASSVEPQAVTEGVIEVSSCIASEGEPEAATDSDLAKTLSFPPLVQVSQVLAEPKRPVSAFFQFQQAHTGCPAQQLSATWKNMSESQRAPWLSRAKVDLKTYQIQLKSIGSNSHGHSSQFSSARPSRQCLVNRQFRFCLEPSFQAVSVCELVRRPSVVDQGLIF